MREDYIAELRHVSKIFPGVKALDDVSIKIGRGEVHGLVGENGAGKSTLIKILSGTYPDYEGQLLINGEVVHFKSEKDALKKGIAVVTQELNPIDELTIEENLFLGREPSKGPFVDRKSRRKKTIESLESLGINFNPTMQMKYLTIAGKQMIEIAKAISSNAKLIIMDEPTSALTEVETRSLFQQIEKLKTNGITVVYISHKLEEIFQLCDTITVIRDGKWIGTERKESVDNNKLVSMMVGRDIANVFPKINMSSVTDTKVLSVEGLTNEKVRNVSLCVHAGEILGIAGIMGAGRTETVRAIFGLDTKDEGNIIYNGQTVDIKSPLTAIKLGMGIVTEDRAAQGFIGIRSIEDNIILPSADKFAPQFFLLKKLISKVTGEISKNLKIKAPNGRTLVSTLSGGNQQKVVLGKWLVRDLKLLILDEPTRGIDIGSKQEIYYLIQSLANQGMAIILISSELPEVISLSHRIMVMADGKVLREFSHKEVTQEKIMDAIVKGKSHE